MPDLDAIRYSMIHSIVYRLLVRGGNPTDEASGRGWSRLPPEISLSSLLCQAEKCIP
jgi:hypothetical protein